MPLQRLKSRSVVAGSLAQQAGRNVVFAADIRQAHLAALEKESQLLMIKAEQLEDGGMQIVDVSGSYL
jgi:hypothetical protein